MYKFRSISSYKNMPFENVVDAVRAELPRIKEVGFDTVWFVLPWREFCPRPLENEDNAAKFQALRGALEMLKENGMQAILPLNYLGPGWEPEGIVASRFILDQNMYASFERYVTRLMKSISDYSDVVHLMVFSENTYHGRDPRAEGPAICADLRGTLGSIVTRIPKSLREQFSFGYHDGEFLTLGYGQGKSPVANPCPFDFLSMVGYTSILRRETAQGIRRSLSEIRSRFEKAHPGVPIVMGEWGTTSCPDKEGYQAKKNMIVLKWAENNVEGHGLWGWFPGPEDQECSNPVYNGLSITRLDGSLKLSAKRIREFYNPPPPKDDDPEEEKGWFARLLEVLFGWMS